jgi:hypothetical protein
MKTEPNGNIVPCEAITAPVDKKKHAAFDVVSSVECVCACTKTSQDGRAWQNAADARPL